MVVSSRRCCCIRCSPARHYPYSSLSSPSAFRFEPLKPRSNLLADPCAHERRKERAHPVNSGRETDRRKDANAREVALLRQRAGGLAARVAHPRHLPEARDRAVPVATASRSTSVTLREVL
jgi:hypothetical protein